MHLNKACNANALTAIEGIRFGNTHVAYLLWRIAMRSRFGERVNLISRVVFANVLPLNTTSRDCLCVCTVIYVPCYDLFAIIQVWCMGLAYCDWFVAFVNWCLSQNWFNALITKVRGNSIILYWCLQVWQGWKEAYTQVVPDWNYYKINITLTIPQYLCKTYFFFFDIICHCP